MYADTNLKDLETRGFVVIRSFLSADDVRECSDDYARQPVDANRNITISMASQGAFDRVKGRVLELAALVRSTTNLHVDRPLGAAYFATGRIAFPWHQDYESFIHCQNHYDYLNVYIPIVKPRRDKSNVSIIPFDTLQKESPRTFQRVVGGGAARFERLGGRRLVFFDDAGKVHLMRTDIDRLAFTPLLDAGDLLLFRGDVIHRTQDADTQRVALSIRVGSSKTLVRRARLTDGSLQKAVTMMKNPAPYERMFRAFEQAGRDELPMAELLDITKAMPSATSMDGKAFFKYLLQQKRRDHLLLSFVRKTVTLKAAGWALGLYRSSRPILRTIRSRGASVPGEREAPTQVM